MVDGVRRIAHWMVFTVLVTEPQVFPERLNIFLSSTLRTSIGQNGTETISIFPLAGIGWDGVIESLRTEREFTVVVPLAEIEHAVLFEVLT